MNKNFYSSKICLISKFKIKIPKYVDFYQSDNYVETYHKILQKQLNKDFLYKCYVILNENLNLNFSKINLIDLNTNILNVKSFVQTPYPKECNIDDGIIITNCFGFNFIALQSKTKNNFYDMCRIRRMKLRMIDEDCYST
tara:strand:- start:149 stop:568 length:420 start_codon:yes stop_codon:yes gene_type:complete